MASSDQSGLRKTWPRPIPKNWTYQVIERVGRGGMGVLFRSIDPVLDREVAIKLMLLDFSEDEEQMRPRLDSPSCSVPRDGNEKARYS